MKNFSQRFAQVLRKRKWTQVVAAKHLGLCQAAICKLLKHNSGCHARTAVQIAQRSGCDIAWLVTGKRSLPAEPRCITRLNKLMGHTRRAA